MLGDPYGYLNLGLLYEEGIYVETNNLFSFIQYKKAADLNNTEGNFKVGYFYYKGLGVDQNLTEAINYLDKAAKFDHPKAIYYLAKIHLYSDVDKAIQYYIKSANL